jgi:osmotically-inducible protein OsmY
MRQCQWIAQVAIITSAALALAGGLPLPASAIDGRIETAARNSYNFKTYLKDDSIKVEATAGVVTLTGTVSQDYHKFLAGETVAGLPGVRSVTNMLTVRGDQPSDQSDLWITMKVKTAMIFHTFINAGTTEVHTQDGVVTLTGSVPTEAKKQMTGACAMDVDGVRDVHNDLVVAGGGVVPQTLGEQVDDASITAQIKTALLFRKSTHALSTQVATKDGTVTLHGEARNAAEKDLVGLIATDIKGVTQVNNKMTLRQP